MTTCLIVGLGNPGARYDGTRHNIGFAVLDALARKYEVEWKAKAAWSAEIAQLSDGALLVKPQTFMNESGKAVRAVAQFYKINPSHVCLVYDERDLPYGVVRWLTGIRTGAHHNGVRSVAAEYHRGIARLRLGIGNHLLAHQPLDQFVLDKFSGDERDQMRGFLDRACAELIAKYQLPSLSQPNHN